MISGCMDSRFCLTRSILYFGVNDELDLSFEVPYPQISDSSLITELIFVGEFKGLTNGFYLVAEPVEPDIAKLFYRKHPFFMTQLTDLHSF